MDIKEKARGQLNWLERILHKIPGFQGYYERELRRDSDRLQREFIVKELRKVKAGLNEVLQAASRQKNFELLQIYDRFGKSLDRSIGEIRYADQGYSGFSTWSRSRKRNWTRHTSWTRKLPKRRSSSATDSRIWPRHLWKRQGWTPCGIIWTRSMACLQKGTPF